MVKGRTRNRRRNRHKKRIMRTKKMKGGAYSESQIRQLENRGFSEDQIQELQEMNKSRVDPALEKYNPRPNAETKVTPFKSYVNPEDRDPSNPETWGKISRNELCPCDSGKKYKHCHGAES